MNLVIVIVIHYCKWISKGQGEIALIRHFLIPMWLMTRHVPDPLRKVVLQSFDHDWIWMTQFSAKSRVSVLPSLSERTVLYVKLRTVMDPPPFPNGAPQCQFKARDGLPVTAVTSKLMLVAIRYNPRRFSDISANQVYFFRRLQRRQRMTTTAT